MAAEESLPNRPLDWILSIICSGMAREIAVMEDRLALLEKREDEDLDVLGEARRRLKEAQRRLDRWKWVPFLGSSLRRAWLIVRDDVRSLKDNISSSRRESDRLRKNVAQASITYEMMIMLGQRDYCVPDPMPSRTRKFVRKFEEIHNKGLVQDHINELAKEISDILGDWAAASLLFLRARKQEQASDDEARESSLVFDKARGVYIETQGGYVSASSAHHGLRRIYLPVPRRWEDRIVRAGGNIDDSTVNHVMSRVWVGFADYERFEQYLPKAYRKVPPDLDFEAAVLEVAASGFPPSPRQRARVVRDMAERQGWRCSLCGSYGGLVWDRLRDMRSAEMSEPLVLRPQWQFRRVGDDTAVAELTDLLLICRDCDLAFETDRLETLLRGREGSLAERVREHVHRRRMMLLRCEESVLATRERALERHLLSLAGVSRWVLDLSRLPEFSDAFKDGIVASEEHLIAGLPVLSEDGEELCRHRSLEDVLAEIGTKATPHLDAHLEERTPDVIAPMRGTHAPDQHGNGLRSHSA